MRPSGASPRMALLQSRAQRAEFVVDLDAQRLEDALGGVSLAPAAVGTAASQRSASCVVVVMRSTERRSAMRRAMRWANRSSPYCGEHPRQLLGAVVVHNVLRRDLAAGVHPHVQESGSTVSEPPFIAVQLQARHAEVEQNSDGLARRTPPPGLRGCRRTPSGRERIGSRTGPTGRSASASASSSRSMPTTVRAGNVANRCSACPPSPRSRRRRRRPAGCSAASRATRSSVMRSRSTGS